MEQKVKFAAGTAKVQGIGKDSKGRQKLMIYINMSSIDLLDLKKGNTIGFNIWIQERTSISEKKSSIMKNNKDNNFVSQAPPNSENENTDKSEGVPIETQEDGTKEIDVTIPEDQELKENWSSYKANEKNKITANYYKDKIIEKIGKEKFEIESKRNN